VNSSLELDRVLPAILEHACAMSHAGGGTIYVFDKASGQFHLAAGHNMSEEHIAMVRAQPVHLGTVVVGQCAECRAAVSSGRNGRCPGRAPQSSGTITLLSGGRA
jgi:hypothetical protein